MNIFLLHSATLTKYPPPQKNGPNKCLFLLSSALLANSLISLQPLFSSFLSTPVFSSSSHFFPLFPSFLNFEPKIAQMFHICTSGNLYLARPSATWARSIIRNTSLSVNESSLILFLPVIKFLHGEMNYWPTIITQPESKKIFMRL